jgi:tRNA-dihydrouridine synthase 2
LNDLFYKSILDVIKAVAEAIDIPVICNGGSKEIEKHSDIWKFKEMCGASSVMVARAAEWNCSILRNEPLMPLMEIIDKYLRVAIDYDAYPANAKYCVQNMLRELQESEMGRKFLDAQTLEQICDVFNLKDYYKQKQAEYLKKGLQMRRDVVPGGENGPLAKKAKIDSDVIEENIAFIRSNYTRDIDLPKSILHTYTKQKLRTVPTYTTEQRDKLFRSTMTLENKKYSSLFWEKNKKFAEQGAAMVCSLHLGLITKKELLDNGSISPLDEV